jgi:hypothetical protein
VLVEKGGLYGFISSEGKEIIKPQYTRVSAFDEVQGAGLRSKRMVL